jgi:hypothetical protein
MRPFENDNEVTSISGLSIENGPDLIVVHGSLEITQDNRSLRRIEDLLSLLSGIREKLLGFGELPEVSAPDIEASKVDVVANPFGDN